MNYAIIMHDKTKSKMQIVEELPEAPVLSYFLCDSWYTCGKLMDSFLKKDSIPLDSQKFSYKPKSREMYTQNINGWIPIV
jgi:hypothetical protein